MNKQKTIKLMMKKAMSLIKIKNLKILTLLSFFTCLILFIFSIYIFIKIKENNFTNSFYNYFLLSSFLIITIIIFFQYISKNLNSILLIVLYSSLFSFYAFELFLHFDNGKIIYKTNIPFYELAKNQNIEWDIRSEYEVIVDLKKNGENIYPNYFPYHLFKNDLFDGFNNDGKFYLPFGGVANITTIMSNELGFFPVLQNDKYGFKNNNKDYEKKTDIVLLGDSYIEGCCTNVEDSIAGNIRKQDLNVLSFGKDGAGPLTQFAILREYLNDNTIIYDNVIWFFSTNDLQNLEIELNSKILKKYLNNDSFTQNLINNQNIVDSILKNYLNKELEKEKKRFKNENNQKNINFKPIKQKFEIYNFLKLYNTRNILQLMPNHPNINTFKKILSKAQIIVKKNNANFYFVYIPSINKFTTGRNYQFKKDVFDITEELQIKTIDLTDVIKEVENPLSLWPFECCGHFNEKGTKKISEYTLKKLN